MKALFLCMDMHNGFHGSFLHTLEYAQYFKTIGYEIYIGSVFISDSNRRIAEDYGFNIFTVDKIPLQHTYDIVYALHMFLFPSLLSKGLKYKNAISATLSAFGGIELIPPSGLWPYIDLFTALSEEIINAYENRFGISGIFTVIPNHIPLDFMNSPQKKHLNEDIHKVAVISNHYIPELFILSKLAPFRVELVGELYRNPQRITPDFIKQYDAVITIGKTTQYCMGLGVPVFQYDKFGGCGYITTKNVLQEEKTNFSGRGTKTTLSPKEIIDRLQSEYKNAADNALELCDLARSRYDIASVITKQLAMVAETGKARKPLKGDALIFSEGSSSMLDYLINTLEIAHHKLD